jgi:hypothetical protein
MVGLVTVDHLLQAHLRDLVSERHRERFLQPRARYRLVDRRGLSPHRIDQQVEHPFELFVAAGQRRRRAHPDDRGDHVHGVDVGAQAVICGTSLEDPLHCG